MSPRLRFLLATCALVSYCAAPSTRPWLQLLANPAACAQRVESLAQALVRIDSLAHFLRRS